ncbi:MAG: hypothetical protein P8X85_03075 [Desulfobacterales bacterium]
MDKENSLAVHRELEKEFKQLELHRPLQLERYETDSQLTYDIITVEKSLKATIQLKIKKFVGGGFAGQVYQVEITDIESETGATIDNLGVGGIYAMKILFRRAVFLCCFATCSTG